MKNENSLKFSPQVIWFPSITVFLIWLVYWFEIKFGYNFNEFGIYPREIKGLLGVVFSPFIHSDTTHLFNNSIPLFVLLMAVLYFYRQVAFKLLLYGVLLSGFITWLIGRDSYHIGASGIIYMLFSFTFFSGVIKKHYRLIALSLAIIFLYGSMVWYIFPTDKNISWEGHLSGFLLGLFFAFIYRNRGMVKEEYQFSKTDFDLLFDEEGNLINEEESEN